MFCAISVLASFCSCTALTMVPVLSVDLATACSPSCKAFSTVETKDWLLLREARLVVMASSSSTDWVPSTWVTWSISLADSAERSASTRTSSATTAKPRPSSPARAASMAAFSASRLVWSAMSRTWLVMLVILRVLATKFFTASAMPLTAFSTLSTSLISRLSWAVPFLAVTRLVCACSRTSWAASATWLMLTVSCSTAAAELAAAWLCWCEAVSTCSADSDRWPATLLASSAPCCTLPMAFTSCSRISASAAITWAGSSLPSGVNSMRRLPAATSRAASTALFSGRVMERVSSQPISAAAARQMAVMVSAVARTAVALVSASLRLSWARSASALLRASTFVPTGGSAGGAPQP